MLRRIRRFKKRKTKIFGKSERPRLSVFRSNRQIYAQIIDDTVGRTLVSGRSDYPLSKGENKSRAAYQLGLLLAKKALEKNIEKVVFDRGAYLFHGRVKALAQGARDGGLKF